MSSTGSSQWHSVEVVYLTYHKSLGTNGTFVQGLPSIDVPINLLSAELLFPSHLVAETEAGGMTKVSHFSSSLPQTTQQHDKYRQRGTKNSFNTMYANAQTQQYILSDWHDEVPADNVRVEIPQVGNHYRFEKLLVMQHSLKISAVYPPPSPSWWTIMWQKIF